jgi:hypothetical protein
VIDGTAWVVASPDDPIVPAPVVPRSLNAADFTCVR